MLSCLLLRELGSGEKYLLDIGSLLLDGSLHCGDELKVSEKGVHPHVTSVSHYSGPC
jgi:hypothetical protein